MGTYIYLAFCRITCLCSYLESGKHWKITDKRGCLRRAFPSIDLLSNAKEADLHFYSAQLVCGSNAQRPVTWWAGGGERAVVSPRRSSSPWKGLWPEPGWRSKPLSQLQVARFLSPRVHPPSQGSPRRRKRCPLSPRAAPAAAATSGRPPPPRLGDPHPHPTGGCPRHRHPPLPAPGLGGCPAFLPWASFPGHPRAPSPRGADAPRQGPRGIGSDAGEKQSWGQRVETPLKSRTPKGRREPELSYRCPQERSSSPARSHKLKRILTQVRKSGSAKPSVGSCCLFSVQI